MTVSKSGRIVAAALAAVLAVAIGAMPASAVPFNTADFAGLATGQVLHADALHATGVNVANVEEAWSGAVVDSQGIGETRNEMNRIVAPAQASKKSFGRGSGLELGLGVDDDTANDLQLQIAEAAAPPSSGPIFEELLGLPATPLAYASVLRGAAEANWNNSSTCVFGKDLANGLGYAADVQLIETGETNEDDTLGTPLISVDSRTTDPSRRVAQSFSHNFLDVQQNEAGNPIGLKFGVSSEVRMNIAPVTLMNGALTLEFLGEWVLRATAGGIPGSAHVHYGPGEASPSTPILRIIQDGEVSDILSFQDLLMNEGLAVEIPGVLEVRVGEDPRALGNPDPESTPVIAANGTTASAALDVVKVTVLDGEALDLRFGHMEVAARVPAGGIDCGVPVTKTASPQGVTVDQAFTVSIKIDNPFGCDMEVVKVTDVITTEGDAKFEILDTNPNANTVPSGANLDSGTIVWNNVGPIAAGSSKTITVSIRAQGGGGIIEDIATAAATMGNCEGEGEGSQLVGSSLPLQVPVVLKEKILPKTGVGSDAAILIALAMLSLAAIGVRQLRRTSI